MDHLQEPARPGSIPYRDETTHLLITAKAGWSMKRIRRSLEGIRELARSTGKTRFLVDATRVGPPDSDFSRYEVGALCAELLPPPVRVAVIYPPELITSFAERVAENRGALFRVCASREEALDWLLAP